MHLHWPQQVGVWRKRRKFCMQQNKEVLQAGPPLMGRVKRRRLLLLLQVAVFLRRLAGICRRMKPMQILCWTAWCS